MPRKNNTVKHQSYPIDRMVCDKRRFKNEKEAGEAAEFQMLKNMTIELFVYKCDRCNYWHLTRSIDKS